MKTGLLLFLAATTVARAINYVGDQTFAPSFSTGGGANLIGNVTLSAPGTYTAANWNIVGNVSFAQPGNYQLLATTGGITITGQLSSTGGPVRLHVDYQRGLNVVVGSSTLNVTVVDDTNAGLLPDDPVNSPPPVPLMNLSARAPLAAGGVLIPGFVVGGTLPRRVLVRAVGPGLRNLGVPDVLENPTLTVFRGSEPIAANDDWAGMQNLRAVFAATGAFGLEATSKDAAVALMLSPGAYTVVVSGRDASDSGDVLVEVYFIE